MSDLNIRRISNEDATAFITIGWKILKGPYYVVLLGAALFVIGASAAISKIPYLGVLSSIPTVFLGIGHMLIVRKIIAGEPVKFTDLFHAFENQEWMQRLLPLAIAGVVLSLVQEGSNQMSGGGFLIGMLAPLIGIFFLLLWFALTAYSSPLIIFKNKTFRESVDLNLRVLGLNWLPILIYTIMLVGLMIVCAILLFLPVIFIALPLYAVSTYLSYAVMFEGLDLVALNSKIDAANAQTPKV